MNYWITFYGEEEKPLKIAQNEFQALQKVLNDVKFVNIRGEMIAVSLIKRIIPIKEKLLALEEPQGEVISKEKLESLKDLFRLPKIPTD